MAVRACESFDIVNFVSLCRKAYSFDTAAASGSFTRGFQGAGYGMGVGNTGLGADHLRRYGMPNFSTATVMFNVRRRNVTGGAPGTFTYSSPYFILFQDEFENNQFGIRLETNGSISLTDGGSTVFYNSTVFVPLVDFGVTSEDYGHMTLRLTQPNGIEFYIGGVNVYNNAVDPTGALPYRYIVAAHNQTGQDVVDLDNFVCTDTEVWGQTYVIGSLPVSLISNSGWFNIPSSTPVVECVNESILTLGDSVNYNNYLRASIGSEKVVFRWRNVGAYDNVKAVVFTVFGLNDDPTVTAPDPIVITTPGSIQIVMVRDSVEMLDTPQDMPTKENAGDSDNVATKGIQFVLETDPYTGLPWTSPDINRTYFGIKLFTGPSDGVTKIFQIHREVVCLSLTGGYGASLEEWVIHTPIWAKG